MRYLQSALILALVFLSLMAAGDSLAQDEQGENDMQMPQIAQGSGEHPIGWVEFHFAELAETQEFYSNVFGWTFEPFTEDYFFYLTPKGLGGGFNGNPPEEPLNTVIYLYAKDIAAVLEQVKQSGGTVAKEKELVHEESGGGIAFFKDPAGVLIGISDMEVPQDYEPDAFKSTDGLVPGSIVHVELYGGELEQTAEFYKGVFGWETASTTPQYMMFNTGKGIYGIFQSHTPALTVIAYIWVEDVAAALDAVEAAGGKRLGEPMKMPGMPTFGYFTDPAGKSLGLMSPGE